MTGSENRWKVIVTDHVETNLDWEEEAYKKAGIEFRHFQLRKAGATEIIEATSDADVLIVDQANISAEVISGLRNCKLIIRHGDGYDNLDLDAAADEGIVCINKPGFWSREVAEQAFGLGISLALKIPVQQSVSETPRTGADAGWDLYRIMPYRRLAALTVGIIGCGKIGTLAAGLFGSTFNRVMACDPYIPKEKIRMAGAEPASLEEVLKEADLISIHTPATPETIGLINSESIGRMKEGALLVNTARGPIVETESLLEGLQSGRLGGAALDSTEPEPLPGDHPLFSRPNVIITPHMGWYSEDALMNMRRSIVEDAVAAEKGRVPDSVRNPDVLESPKLRMRNS